MFSVTNLKFDNHINPFNDTINFIKFPELKLVDQICKVLLDNNSKFRIKNNLDNYTLGQLGDAFKPFFYNFIVKVENFMNKNPENNPNFN